MTLQYFLMAVALFLSLCTVTVYYYATKIRTPKIKRRLQSIPDFDDKHIHLSNTSGLAFDYEKPFVVYDDGQKTVFISASELLTPKQDPYHVETQRNRKDNVLHLRTLNDKLPRIDLLFDKFENADRCKNALIKVIDIQTPSLSQGVKEKERQFSEKEQKTIATLKHLLWVNDIKNSNLTTTNLKAKFGYAVELAFQEFPRIHNSEADDYGNQIVLRQALEFIFLPNLASKNPVGYTKGAITTNTSKWLKTLRNSLTTPVKS